MCKVIATNHARPYISKYYWVFQGRAKMSSVCNKRNVRKAKEPNEMRTPL